MLRSLKEMIGYKLHAQDGVIGHVADFFAEHQTWRIRYMVANTGSWLPGKQVLIFHDAIKSPHWREHEVDVDLTIEQIKNSPHVDEEKPVSRQKEIELFQFYDWNPYWNFSGPYFIPAEITQVRDGEDQTEPVDETDKHEIRSFRELQGYELVAQDGHFGYADDWIVELDDWKIRYWVVHTHKWLPGKSFLVSPDWIEDISWNRAQVTMNLSKAQIKESPEYDPSMPINREYEIQLYDFYGRPVYWHDQADDSGDDAAGSDDGGSE